MICHWRLTSHFKLCSDDVVDQNADPSVESEAENVGALSVYNHPLACTAPDLLWKQ